MALGVFNEIDPNAETFSAWLAKSNEMIRIFEGQGPGLHSAMTAIDGGWAETIGNAILTGEMVANVMVVHDELRGGDNLANGTLFVSTNTTFQDTSDIVFVDSTIKLEVTNNTEIHQSLLVADVGGGSLAAAARIYGNTFVEEYLEIGSQPLGSLNHTTADSLKITGANVVFNTYSSNSVSLIRTSVDGDLEISADVGANGTGVTFIDMNVDGINAISIDSANVDFYNNTGVATKMRWVGDTDTSEGSLLIRKLLPIANAALDVDGEARVDSLIVDGSVTSNAYVGNNTYDDATLLHSHFVNIRKGDIETSGIVWQTTTGSTSNWSDTRIDVDGTESLILSVDDTVRGITTADIDLKTAGVRRVTTYANGDVAFTNNGVDQVIWDDSRGTQGYFRHLDDVRATWGADDDFNIFHNGTHSYIVDTGTGNTYLQTDTNFLVTNQAGTANSIVANTVGEVSLYHNNDRKLQTNAYGVEITGEANTDTLRVSGDGHFDGSTDGISPTLDSNNIEWLSLSNTMNFDDDTYLEFGTSGDFKIHHDGSHTYMQDTAGVGNVYLDTNTFIVRNAAGNENMIRALQDTSVTLYYNNGIKIETTDIGVEITGEANTGTLNVRGDARFESDALSADEEALTWTAATRTMNWHDNAVASFGTDGTDLLIYHDGSASWIQEAGAGNLIIEGTDMTLRATDDSRYLRGVDGTVTTARTELYSPGDDLIALTANSDQVHITNLANTNTLRVRSTSLFENNISIEGSDSTEGVSWDKTANTMNFNDNNFLTFGTTADLSIYHDVNNSVIRDSGTGDLILEATNLNLRATDGTRYALFTDGAGLQFFSPTSNTEEVVINDDGLFVTNEANTDTLTVRNTSLFQNDMSIEGSTSAVTVTWDKSANNLQLLDNNYISFGALDDLRLYHTGTTSHIENQVGELVIDQTANDEDIVIRSDDSLGGVTDYIRADGSTGEVVLSHYGTTKLQTKVGGIVVTGNTVADGFVAGDNEKLQLGDSQDLELYHNTTNSVVENNTGALVIQNNANDNDVVIKSDDSAGGLADYIRADGSSGEVILYHYGSPKLATKTTGVVVTGRVDADGFRAGDGELIQLGDAQEFQIVHTAAGDSTISETGGGDLILQANNLILESTTGENYFQGTADGGAIVYFNGLNRLETTNAGATLTGTLIADGVTVGDNEIIQLGTTMQLYNDGAISYINETGTGSLVLQGNNIILESTTGENYLQAVADGATSIYWGGTSAGIKLNTTQTGVNVTGETDTDTLLVSGTSSLRDDIGIQGSTNADTVTWDKSANTLNFDDNNFVTFGTSADLQIYHDTNNSFIREQGTGQLNIDGSIVAIRDVTDGHAIATFTDGAGVVLRHNNSTKFETSSTGATLTGTLVADGVTVGDDEIIQLGTTMQLYNDGANSYIVETGTGDLNIQSNNLVLESTAGESYLVGQSDSSVSIFYNGASKLNTTATGVNVTGNVVSDGLNVDGGSYVSGSTRLGSAVAPTATLDVTGNAKISTTLEVTSNISTNGNVLPLTEFNDLGSLTARWDAFLGDVQIGDTKNILPEVTATSAATGSDVGSDALRFNIYGHIGDFTGAVQVDGNITTDGDVTLTTGDLTVSTGGLTVQNDSTFNSNVVFTNIQVNGTANIQLLELESIVANNVALIGNGQVDVATNAVTTLDSFPLSQSRGLKYMVQGDNGNPASAFVIEIMVAHNDTNVFFTRYAEVSNAFDCTLTPVINGTDMQLRVECPSGAVGNVHSFNIVRTEVR